MGVDLEAVMDIGLDDVSPATVLAALQSSYEDMHKLWHDHYEIPVNAGFKALNLEQFRKIYTSNWTMPDVILQKNNTCDEVSEVGIYFNGPYGWRAELCRDAVVFCDGTRWGKFCSDDQCRQLMVNTIALFASTLLSTRACFVPDSSYSGSECVSLLWEDGNFNSVLDCLRSDGGMLENIRHKSRHDDVDIFTLVTDKNPLKVD